MPTVSLCVRLYVEMTTILFFPVLHLNIKEVEIAYRFLKL